MNILSEIEKAITTKTAIEIKYNGGSHPGTKRAIIPTKIDGDKVFAICEETGQNKSFILSKIELPLSDTPQYSEYQPIQDNDVLQDVFNSHRDSWGGFGWHVECGETGIRLFSVYKNGKPYKNPTLGIAFDRVLEQRPWVVFCKGRQTLAYADIKRAVSRFLEYADSFINQ